MPMPLPGLLGVQAQTAGAASRPLGGLLDPSVALPIAAALMGNQGNMANLGNAFAAAGPALQQRAQVNKTRQFLAQDPQYAQLLDAGMSPKDVLDIYARNKYQRDKINPYDQRADAARQYGLDPNSVEGRNYILSGDLPEARGGAAELGLNPQYGVDENGNPVLIQIGKDGKAVRTAMPEGVALSKAPIKLDAGTHFVLLDPITRQPVGQIPKDLAGAEAQKEIGGAQGKAAAAAPGDYQAGMNAVDLVDQIRNDPYLSRGTGFSSYGNAVAGTGGFDFQNKVDQAKSGAFLTAVQQLRGLGALSNSEGQAATAAITRINTATSEEAFRAALDDYERIIQQGIVKAERMGAKFGVEMPTQQNDGWTDMGNGVRVRQVK